MSGCFVFPTGRAVGSISESTGGLTKREYFAAMAMQAICQDRTAVYSIKSIAKGAVEYADALIEELAKGEPKVEKQEKKDGQCEHRLAGAVQCLLCQEIFTGEIQGLNKAEKSPDECRHRRWVDMECGLGQCRDCLAFLPYSQMGANVSEPKITQNVKRN